MKFLAHLSFFLSFSTLAATAPVASTPWQNLSVDDTVYLTQNLVLDGKYGGTIRVLNGETYKIHSIEPLEGLSVVDFVFLTKNCRFPDVEGALTMILPVENSKSSKAEVGVYFLRGCALEVLVEAKDFGRTSFFRM